MKQKNVVVIGGGTGIFSVLTGLKEYPYRLHVIVSMADDGGSTGALREEFGILPPGDIRRALVALSTSNNKILSELFNYRFSEGKTLKGHSLGNLLLTALERITGDFKNALREAGKILNVKGEIIPVALDQTQLCAELEDGQVVSGESNIDIPKHDGSIGVKKIYLRPEVEANPDAVAAIKKADAIILGPGDLYTSILPNVIVKGISEAIGRSKAKKIYIVNIMTKFGETYGFSASTFSSVMESYLGQGVIDYCVINTETPNKKLLSAYEKEQDEPVAFDKENFGKFAVNVVTGRMLRRDTFLRHDPEKLAKVLSKIIDSV